jgi:hypothetical protein
MKKTKTFLNHRNKILFGFGLRGVGFLAFYGKQGNHDSFVMFMFVMCTNCSFWPSEETKITPLRCPPVVLFVKSLTVWVTQNVLDKNN